MGFSVIVNLHYKLLLFGGQKLHLLLLPVNQLAKLVCLLRELVLMGFVLKVDLLDLLVYVVHGRFRN